MVDIGKVVESLRSMPPLLWLVIWLSTGVLLFGPAWLVSELEMAQVVGNYRWLVGLLFLVSCAWLVCFVGSWFWNGLYALCRRRCERQQSRIIDGMLWRWRRIDGKVKELDCYCPGIDCTRLVGKESNPDCATSCNWNESAWQTTFKCETCGHTFGPFKGRHHQYRQSVERQIERLTGYRRQEKIVSTGLALPSE